MFVFKQTGQFYRLGIVSFCCGLEEMLNAFSISLESKRIQMTSCVRIDTSSETQTPFECDGTK